MCSAEGVGKVTILIVLNSIEDQPRMIAMWRRKVTYRKGKDGSCAFQTFGVATSDVFVIGHLAMNEPSFNSHLDFLKVNISL